MYYKKNYSETIQCSVHLVFNMSISSLNLKLLLKLYFLTLIVILHCEDLYVMKGIEACHLMFSKFWHVTVFVRKRLLFHYLILKVIS